MSADRRRKEGGMTTVTVDRKVLCAAVRKVSPAISRYSKALHRYGVRITSDGSAASVEANNLDLALWTPLDATVKGAAGSVVLYANRLTTVAMRGLAGSTVTITFGKRPTITDGKTTVWLDAMDPEGWPQRRTASGEAVRLTAEDVTVLRRVASATSTDFARPILTGVLLENGNVVGTDSYRLHVGSSTATPSQPVLMPNDAVRVLPRDGATLVIDHGDRFSWGDDSEGGSSRLVQGDFPQWEKLMPAVGAAAYSIVVDRLTLLGAALRAEAVIGPNHADPVMLQQASGGLSVNARRANQNLFSETVDAGFDGAATGVALNAGFLVASLQAFTGKTVRVDITSDLRPVLFSDDEDDGFRCLLMPVRVEWAEKVAA